MALDIEVLKGLNRKLDGLKTEVGNDYVPVRLNVLEPSEQNTITLRGESFLYVDHKSESRRISLEQIKGMSTKIVVGEDKNLQELSAGDYIYE